MSSSSLLLRRTLEHSLQTCITWYFSSLPTLLLLPTPICLHLNSPEGSPEFPRLYPIGPLAFDRIKSQQSCLNQPGAIVNCLFTNGRPRIAGRPGRNNRISGGSDASNGTTRSTAPLAAYPQIPIYTPVDRLDLGDHDAAPLHHWELHI